jgi:formate hydrogenlyase subunit 6/NADH:ubiquinone oxidoreductase subunit I
MKKAGLSDTGQQQPIRLGTAFYDRGRCLPWAMATDCIVCEEWCPVSPKAIYVQEAQVVDSAGNTKTLKQPHIDPSRCVGCGACEYACPLQEHPGSLRHQHWRKPLAQQPDSAQQEVKENAS